MVGRFKDDIEGFMAEVSKLEADMSADGPSETSLSDRQSIQDEIFEDRERFREEISQ